MLRMHVDLRARDCRIVGEAVDGVDAIEKVRELGPHVVVMDYNMPRLNGVDTTKAIAREFPAVRVIGYTSASAASSVEELIAAGAADAFPKSDLEGLLQALGCAVDP